MHPFEFPTPPTGKTLTPDTGRCRDPDHIERDAPTAPSLPAAPAPAPARTPPPTAALTPHPIPFFTSLVRVVRLRMQGRVHPSPPVPHLGLASLTSRPTRLEQ